MEAERATGVAPLRVNGRIALTFGAVSVLTMPITAIWFLLAGFLTLVGAAVLAGFTADPARAARVLAVGLSVALGLLVGPAIYLALALLS